MAEASFLIFAALAAFGWWKFTTYVADRTNYSWSGWAIYTAIVFVPTVAFLSCMVALIGALWGQVK